MLLHFVCSFERKNMRWFRNIEELSVSREIILYQMLKRNWILVLKFCMYSGLLEHEWNIRENSLALLCVEFRFVHQPQENAEPAYDFERTRRKVVIDTSKYFRNFDPESNERSPVIVEIRFIYHFWELRFYAYPACGLHFLSKTL